MGKAKKTRTRKLIILTSLAIVYCAVAAGYFLYTGKSSSVVRERTSLPQVEEMQESKREGYDGIKLGGLETKTGIPWLDVCVVLLGPVFLYSSKKLIDRAFDRPDPETGDASNDTNGKVQA